MLSSVVLTSPGGAASTTIPLPSDLTFAGATYFTQWSSFDLVNSQPFKTSNGARSLVGL